MPADDERFEKRDLPMVLMFIFMGILVLAFVVLSFVRGSLIASPVLYVLGGLLGLLLLYLGLNGLVKVIRSPAEGSDD
ncbi:MAG: hypothetical protein ACYS99_15045 [Planctomycetota bacterium]|jgi:hypothetical protein